MLWQKLPEKNIACGAHQKRVLQFDPTEVSKLKCLYPYVRHQNISMIDIFPLKKGFCGCGCGQILTGRRTRWAIDECEYFAVAVREIIYGQTPVIRHYLELNYGWRCFICGSEDKGHDMGANGYVSWIKIDHIIPVKLGGGACWLSNYQLLCHDCHVKKTGKDFNWKSVQWNHFR